MLAHLAAGSRLDEAAAEAAFEAVMSGEASDVEIAALLMAMRVRGETVEELAGAVRALTSRMIGIAAPAGAIDVCGTGGDGRETLNVSTAVAFVVAGAGVPVAKHGNRALTSRTGGADVLAALGVGLELSPERLERCLERVGLAFLFAPRHHAALRHAAAARAALPTRTILNLAGPLANPARVRRQLVGVYDPAWLEPMAAVLHRLGGERAWLVHGDGLDELTLSGPSEVVALEAGRTRRFTLSPEAVGLGRRPVEAIRGGGAEDNAAALLALLEGAPGAYRDTVLLNAAAALVVSGVAHDLPTAMRPARRSIDDGAALRVLHRLRQETSREGQGLES